MTVEIIEKRYVCPDCKNIVLWSKEGDYLGGDK